MTDAPADPVPSALLVHGTSATWRQAMRASLRQRFAALPRASDVTLLLSSREAEAAKCLADPRVVLVVAIDEPGIRRTLASLHPSLPVVWATDTNDTNDTATQVGMRLDALFRAGQRASSA